MRLTLAHLIASPRLSPGISPRIRLQFQTSRRSNCATTTPFIQGNIFSGTGTRQAPSLSMIIATSLPLYMKLYSLLSHMTITPPPTTNHHSPKLNFCGCADGTESKLRVQSHTHSQLFQTLFGIHPPTTKAAQI